MQIALIKYKFIAEDTYIEVADEVGSNSEIVIDTTRGQLITSVVAIVNKQVKLDNDIKFVRVATNEDLDKLKKLNEKTPNVKAIADKLILKHKCDMKIVDVDYTLDGGKVIFSFVCEDRVDFRELVKEMASELKLRIELRQIGIRDYAKSIGCMGVCGKECCCKQYLNDFDKVSIKMAKNQNLSLNPVKISGTCGRLMCCLSFENETYQELGKTCPKVGAKVNTPDGEGVVINVNILKQTCVCRIEKGDDVKILEYPVDKVKKEKRND